MRNCPGPSVPSILYLSPPSLSFSLLSPGALFGDTKCWVYVCTEWTIWGAGLTAMAETFLGDDPGKLGQPVIKLSRGTWKLFVTSPQSCHHHENMKFYHKSVHTRKSLQSKQSAPWDLEPRLQHRPTWDAQHVFLSMDRVSTRLVGSWAITLDSTYS